MTSPERKRALAEDQARLTGDVPVWLAYGLAIVFMPELLPTMAGM